MLHNADVTFDIAAGAMDIHHHRVEPWRVTIVDTGEKTTTGGRLRHIRSYLGQEDFCMTYGDGVGDIDITQLIRHHRDHGRHATVTAAQPVGRFGAMGVDGDRVVSFKEKPLGDGSWVNAGFFVLKPCALDYIDGDVMWGDRTTGRRRPAPRALSCGVLASDGYLARQDDARRDVEQRQRAVEVLGSMSTASFGMAVACS